MIKKTTQAGKLSDPATFGGAALGADDSLVVGHAVEVDTETTVAALTVGRKGKLIVARNLTIQGDAKVHGVVQQLPGSIVAFDAAYNTDPDRGLVLRLIGRRARWIAEGTAEEPCLLVSSSHGGYLHLISTAPVSRTVSFTHAEAVDVIGFPVKAAQSFKAECRKGARLTAPARPFSFARLLLKLSTLGLAHV